MQTEILEAKSVMVRKSLPKLMGNAHGIALAFEAGTENETVLSMTADEARTMIDWLRRGPLDVAHLGPSRIDIDVALTREGRRAWRFVFPGSIHHIIYMSENLVLELPAAVERLLDDGMPMSIDMPILTGVAAALFERIKHGGPEYRAWLRRELHAFFVDKELR